MPLLSAVLATFRLAVWGSLLFLPVSIATADAPRPRSSGQPHLPFLRRYVKPPTDIRRAPASVARPKRAPSAARGRPHGRPQARNTRTVPGTRGAPTKPGGTPDGRGIRGRPLPPAPIVREPARQKPAEPPPPYAASPKSNPAAPSKNIQLRQPGERSHDGSRSIRLDMTRPYLR